MKRFGTVILTAAIAATMIAGCGNKLSDTDPSAATGLTTPETSASAEVSSETTPETPKTFEDMYGNQIMNYMDHQYYFDGEPLLKQESNFYYINAFVDLSGYANMGYYPATPLGFLDLAAEYDGEEYKTYGDYYVYYAENSIESTCILCARAKAEGVSLDADTMKQIDEMIENLKTTKAPEAGLSFEEYLQLWYGPGMDETSFRAVVERYFLADAYSKEYCQNYQFTDAEKKVPYVRYALFYAPQTADQATKDKALASANAMKDACKTIDDLTGLSETALANNEVMDQGDIAVPKGQMVKAFEEWAYGKDRKEGELDVIYAQEYGYFVVGYLGKEEKSQDELDALALTALSEEISNEIDTGKYQFGTDQAYEPAIPVAAEGDVYDPAAGELMLNITTTPTPSAEMAPGGDDTANTIIWVLAIIGGVAVVGVIVILIVSVVGKKDDKITGKAKKEKAGKEEPADTDTEPEETDGDEE